MDLLTCHPPYCHAACPGSAPRLPPIRSTARLSTTPYPLQVEKIKGRREGLPESRRSTTVAGGHRAACSPGPGPRRGASACSTATASPGRSFSPRHHRDETLRRRRRPEPADQDIVPAHAVGRRARPQPLAGGTVRPGPVRHPSGVAARSTAVGRGGGRARGANATPRACAADDSNMTGPFPHYHHRRYDPFWEACESLGMVVASTRAPPRARFLSAPGWRRRTTRTMWARWASTVSEVLCGGPRRPLTFLIWGGGVRAATRNSRQLH